MEDARLRNFVTVAAERSFTRAARKLGLTQSAVSQSIMELENELGTRLFERGRGTDFSLTSSGLLFLDYAQKILSWYGAATGLFSTGKGGKTLRLCIRDNAAAAAVSPVLSSLAVEGIILEMTSAEDPSVQPDIVLHASLLQPDLETSAFLLSSIPLAAAASPENRSAAQGGIENCRIAVWKEAAPALGMSLRHLICASSDDASVLLDLASGSSDIVAVVPSNVLDARLRGHADELVRIPLKETLGYVNLYCEPSKSFSGTAMYRLFRSRLDALLNFD